jgi:uncharacterized protein (TIGR04255 family)
MQRKPSMKAGEDALAESPTPLNLLNLPDVQKVEFERNFIKTAVCELRFPTLLEFETKPPVQLQKELRKEYPYYEPAQSVSVGPGVVDRETRYLFRSRKKDWSVAFKASAIALETTHYTNFEEFSQRLENLFAKSRSLLDTDFFTRVGLRYIDEIPIEDGELAGWVRDDLVAPLTQGVYGTVEHFLQEVRGFTAIGRYTFRHGMAGSAQEKHRVYSLDFDFYEENVPFDSVLSMVSQFNQQSFRFFSWAIGPKALSRLGKATTKPGRT